MYKILYIDNHNISNLEAMLNDSALDGYRWVEMIPATGRFVIVLEQLQETVPPPVYRKPGRPKKDVSESEGRLGE